jgi:hypothetical protein
MRLPRSMWPVITFQLVMRAPFPSKPRSCRITPPEPFGMPSPTWLFGSWPVNSPEALTPLGLKGPNSTSEFKDGFQMPAIPLLNATVPIGPIAPPVARPGFGRTTFFLEPGPTYTGKGVPCR